ARRRAGRSCPYRDISSAIAAAGKVALYELEQRRDALLGRRSVGDVLAGERRLMHRGVHVTGIEGVDVELGVLYGEDPRELLEHRLRRAIAAPALVGLDGGVGRHVDDAAAGRDVRECGLDESERRQRVDVDDVAQRVERI